MTGDVTHDAEVRAMFERAAAGWGPPAIVVANAGAAESRPFLRTSEEDFGRCSRST